MGLTIRHTFESAKADSSDSTLIQPSHWNADHDILNFPFNIVTDFDFDPIQPGGSLSAGSNTITLTTVPKGINGTNTNHYLYIYDGTGTAEVVLITGGTAVSEGTSQTIIVTCANTHSGSWKIKSATAGWQEAAYYAGASGSVFFPSGTYTVYGKFTVPYNNQNYYGENADSIFITPANSTNIPMIANVSGKSNITFDKLGFEGNFVNQSYANSTLIGAIYTESSTNIKVQQCRFHGFGYSNISYSEYAQVIRMYTVYDAVVRNCVFQSNLAQEISFNPVYNGIIEGCQLGSSLVAQSNTASSYWDTYSGGFGIFIASSTNVIARNNVMYGTQRAISHVNGVFIGLNGSGGPTCSKIQIHDNYFYGIGNGVGTVTVTNGSGSIVGSSTGFSTSLDVKRKFMVEGDTTIYTISAVSSATGLTVTPTISRASGSGLKYQYINSGDVIVAYNVQGLSISNNTVEYSGDNGYDIAGSGSNQTGNFLFSNNTASYCQNDGLFLGGSLFNGLISNNKFTNNGLQQLSGHQAGIELSPTNQGETTAKPMWHLVFDGNQFIDDQVVSTQICGFVIETASYTSILTNTLTPSNTFYAYNNGTPTGSMFDTNCTSQMIGDMFSYVPWSSPLQLVSVKFADLGNLSSAVGVANGMMVYCYDAKSISDGVSAGSTAVGSGTGAVLVRQNGAWKVGF